MKQCHLEIESWVKMSRMFSLMTTQMGDGTGAPQWLTSYTVIGGRRHGPVSGSVVALSAITLRWVQTMQISYTCKLGGLRPQWLCGHTSHANPISFHARTQLVSDMSASTKLDIRSVSFNQKTVVKLILVIACPQTRSGFLSND